MKKQQYNPETKQMEWVDCGSARVGYGTGDLHRSRSARKAEQEGAISRFMRKVNKYGPVSDWRMKRYNRGVLLRKYNCENLGDIPIELRIKEGWLKKKEKPVKEKVELEKPIEFKEYLYNGD